MARLPSDSTDFEKKKKIPERQKHQQTASILAFIPECDYLVDLIAIDKKNAPLGRTVWSNLEQELLHM